MRTCVADFHLPRPPALDPIAVTRLHIGQAKITLHLRRRVSSRRTSAFIMSGWKRVPALSSATSSHTRSTPLLPIERDDPARGQKSIRTARSRTSGANLFVVLLMQGPPAQRLEPSGKPGVVYALTMNNAFPSANCVHARTRRNCLTAAPARCRDNLSDRTAFLHRRGLPFQSHQKGFLLS